MPQTASKVFRLRDILTKEVSLVDRAANQRVFLLTKRDAAETEQPLEDDGKGGLKTTAEKADDTGKSPADTEKPVPPAPQPAALVMTKGTLAGIVTVVEKLTAIAAQATSSDDVTADGAGVEKALLDVLGALGTVSDRPVPPLWEGGVWKCGGATLQKALKTASEKLAEVAESLAVSTDDDAPPAEVRWRITDVLDALVEMTRFEPAEAALSKSTFQALAKGLQEALAEQLAPPPPPPVAPGPDAESVVAAAESVIKALREQLHVRDQRIQALEREPGLSHRLPVGETTATQKREEKWPMDMAAKVYPQGEDLSFA